MHIRPGEVIGRNNLGAAGQRAVAPFAITAPCLVGVDIGGDAHFDATLDELALLAASAACFAASAA
jgi:hypothetical protein